MANNNSNPFDQAKVSFEAASKAISAKEEIYKKYVDNNDIATHLRLLVTTIPLEMAIIATIFAKEGRSHEMADKMLNNLEYLVHEAIDSIEIVEKISINQKNEQKC